MGIPSSVICFSAYIFTFYCCKLAMLFLLFFTLINFFFNANILDKKNVELCAINYREKLNTSMIGFSRVLIKNNNKYLIEKMNHFDWILLQILKCDFHLFFFIL